MSVLRSLARRRSFSAVVIGTLALGIGADVALFSVVDGVLLEPLPFPDARDLVMVWEENFPRERRTNVVSPANFIEWREQSESFTTMAALSTGAVTLTGDHAPVRLPAARVTEEFFDVLATEPFLGRSFSAEDGDHVTVLGYDVWRGRFGANPAVIGTPVRLNDEDYTVVGVMPKTFRFELDPTDSSLQIEADFWRPLIVSDEWREERGRFLAVLARKRSDLTFQQVQAEMDTVAARLERDHPRANTGWGVNVVPLTEQMVGTARPTLMLLFSAVSLMLLLACVNIANLLLGRGIGRRRELAIRTAIGASSGRITRQLLLESAVMTAVAGALGVVVAHVGVFAIARFSPVDIPRLDNVSVDGGAVALALSLTALTAILFGVVPALQARHTDVHRALRGDVGGVSSLRFRSGLVAFEVAITVVLLAGAGLLMRTLLSYRAVDPGFERTNTLTMKLALPDARYSSDAARLAFFDELRERVSSLPGVEAVGVVSSVPLTGPHAATRFHAGDRPPPADGEAPVADIRIIGGDYFRSMAIPLLAGRTFDSADDADQPLRAIISTAAVETLWPGVPPNDVLGRTIEISWGGLVPYEVVGVVGDVHHASLDTRPRPMVYWSHHQTAWGQMSLVVRGGEFSSVQSEIWALDPSLPPYDIRPMDEIVNASIATERLSAVVVGVFAGAALVIASLGVYGVIGFFVSQRSREMGLRLALGASPLEVMSGIVGRGMVMTLAGLVAGMVGVLFTSRLMVSLLFEVRPLDPLTLVLVSVVLGLVALLACYLPARRASRLDPAAVLRSE